jgi:hypothetical protein
MPRNGGVSFIRIWSPSPETGDGRQSAMAQANSAMVKTTVIAAWNKWTSSAARSGGGAGTGEIQLNCSLAVLE